MLKIRAGAEEYVAEVAKWATMNGHLGALAKVLAYLDTYADEDRSGRTIVEISKDFVEHSFSVTWLRRKKGDPSSSYRQPWDKPGKYHYEPWMNGGVIWHASDKSWGVHT